MKTEDYVIGKWYKNLGKSEDYIGKLDIIKNNQFWHTDYISSNKTFFNSGGWLALNENTCECSLNEVQEYFPEGHPDKIKSSLVGRYIKALIDKPDMGIVKKDEIGLITETQEEYPHYADFPSQKGYVISKDSYLDGKHYELMPVGYSPNVQTNEEYLLEEAKKRYPVGTKFKSLQSDTIYTIRDYSGTKSNGWLSNNYVIVYVEGVVSRGEYLYKSGDWAEIVEDKEVFPKYVEYIDTKYKGIIVKVEDWCCGSYCKVIFFEGIREQPFKHLVKPSTEKAYFLQNSTLYQYPLKDEECYNTEIEVGDEVELTSCEKSYYINNYLGQKAIIVKLNSTNGGSYSSGTHWVKIKDNGKNEHWKVEDLKLVKKHSNTTIKEQVDVSSPKVTNEITVPRINTISRDKLIHINIETNTKSITIPKLETKSSEIKNIKIQSFSLTI